MMLDQPQDMATDGVTRSLRAQHLTYLWIESEQSPPSAEVRRVLLDGSFEVRDVSRVQAADQHIVKISGALVRHLFHGFLVFLEWRWHDELLLAGGDEQNRTDGERPH